ncbi:deleted in malignant brain tumors 1 protein-like isoform X2 [Heptranchias perlo]|uniref:deleted in malignant brain tumors 1 protein-like isoform X2 n=1 Tax=Heptranchias perlo TaxID=212740 RepID=UPI00355A96E7
MASIGRVLLNIFLITFAFHGKNDSATQDGGACGRYLVANSGSFASPNFPHQYPSNAQCTWYIRVGINQRIMLNFTELHMEVSPRCSHDYIIIYDGPSINSALIATTCTGSNNIFVSSSSSMTVYFRSDSNETRRGFSAYYYSLPSHHSEGASCGGYLVDDSGSFASPNYPQQYPINSQCTWYIRVGINQRIKLNITDLQMVTGASCKFNHVEIYNGPSMNSALIAKICSESERIFISSSNSMTVHFTTDFSLSNQGFSANYNSMSHGATCGGYLVGHSETFASPNYPHQYPNNAQCAWYIRVDSNQCIRLDITEIQAAKKTLLRRQLLNPNCYLPCL